MCHWKENVLCLATLTQYHTIVVISLYVLLCNIKDTLIRYVIEGKLWMEMTLRLSVHNFLPYVVHSTVVVTSFRPGLCKFLKLP